MSGSNRGSRAVAWLPAASLACGFALVLAVHPEPFGGWALLALGPLLFLAGYALAFRTPPRALRLVAGTAVALAYALVYGLVAGIGDESAGKEVSRAVYVGLPALGLAAMLACLAVVELAGAAATRPTHVELADGRAGERAARLLVAVGTLASAAWAIVAATGIGEPRLVVADAEGPPAALADVTCDGEDTYVATPVVIAQGTGVRIRVVNRGGGEIWFEYDLDDGSGGGGAELLERGPAELLVLAPERTLGVACTERGDGTAGEYATMTVERP